MTTLLLVFHPNLAGSRLNGAWARVGSECGCVVRDMYAEMPSGVPEVGAEQAICEGFDRLVFQHPLHWYSAPWLMKRWIDEVLTFGWAYGGPDRLAGKRWGQIVSVGAAEAEYERSGSRALTGEDLMRPFAQTARFCRMVPDDPLLVFGSGYLDEAGIAASCERVRGYLGGER